MNRDYEHTLLSGNPFSREYRHALVESVSRLGSGNGELDRIQTRSPVVPVQFLATITGSTAILANRVWKYTWTELPPVTALASGSRTSTEGSDEYFYFALNGPELNNPAETFTAGAGIVDEARATFGIKTGVVAATGSTVTLLPLNEGPNPVVFMTALPNPVVVSINSTDYSCSHWMSAANQVDVTCG